MSRLRVNWKLVLIAFVAVSALADDIDAEIVKNLDFYDQMSVVEDLDLIETEAQTQPDESSTADLSDATQGGTGR